MLPRRLEVVRAFVRSVLDRLLQWPSSEEGRGGEGREVEEFGETRSTRSSYTKGRESAESFRLSAKFSNVASC